MSIESLSGRTGIDLSDAVESKIKLNGGKNPVEKCWCSSKKYMEF